MSGSSSDAGGICERSRHVCACLCVSSTNTFCDCSVERMAWDIYGLELSLVLWMENCFLLKWPCCVSGYLQNWEMGASIWAEAPPLELSFWTWVGGTGLWDWPVARYMAWTHRMRSCSSSLAKITVSPSFTALKKARPPSKPETGTIRYEWFSFYNVYVCALVAVWRVGVLSHLAEGHCSPQCTRPAGEAPVALTFSLCSCTWRMYTDSPTTQKINHHFSQP